MASPVKKNKTKASRNDPLSLNFGENKILILRQFSNTTSSNVCRKTGKGVCVCTGVPGMYWTLEMQPGAEKSVFSLHISSMNATKKLIYLKPLSSTSKLQGPIKALLSRKPMFSGDEAEKGYRRKRRGEGSKLSLF